MIYEKSLFGSKLTIEIKDKNIDKDIIDKCFKIAKSFEFKYSRFIKGNYLYELNKNKSSQINGELLSIINLCKKVSSLTDGYFDITILPIIENIGYGIYEEKLKENIGYEKIEIVNGKINLKGGISIDLGAVGKGYIIDKIFNILDPIYKDFIINFGGDIKVKGEKTIYLEDPLEEKKSIGTIKIKNHSIASSNPYKRETKKGNHLINTKNRDSNHEKIAVYTTHKLSSFSDIFSTALFVTPIEKVIEVLNKVNGLEAMIILKNGDIYKSKGFIFEKNN